MARDDHYGGSPPPRETVTEVVAAAVTALQEADVPYVVVEAYKPQFCKLREAELGGGCVNMWEFYGDIGSGMLGFEDSCQFSECDSTRGLEFEEAVAYTPQGEGFKEALSEWLDWDAFHRFQCLSWILETGDDALHNMNNVLLVERVDVQEDALKVRIRAEGLASLVGELRQQGERMAA